MKTLTTSLWLLIAGKRRIRRRLDALRTDGSPQRAAASNHIRDAIDGNVNRPARPLVISVARDQRTSGEPESDDRDQPGHTPTPQLQKEES